MKYYIIQLVEAKTATEALEKKPRQRMTLAVLPEKLKAPKQLAEAIGFQFDPPEDEYED